MRLHILRHSYEWLALGESPPMIRKQLGHALVQTAAQYARFEEESVKESAVRIAASIGDDVLSVQCGGNG